MILVNEAIEKFKGIFLLIWPLLICAGVLLIILGICTIINNKKYKNK